ncbi:hypothetical protein [Endozoicomonas ascidiicola]|uniref:hypothetical protein n=1 Tax=Endozoicomonas ascidiicola TaxID=1698521 RepID=UPI000831864A|nr:hypothetical protein [Endozoicomonas ascidiicola]
MSKELYQKRFVDKKSSDAILHDVEVNTKGEDSFVHFSGRGTFGKIKWAKKYGHHNNAAVPKR